MYIFIYLLGSSEPFNVVYVLNFYIKNTFFVTKYVAVVLVAPPKHIILQLLLLNFFLNTERNIAGEMNIQIKI